MKPLNAQDRNKAFWRFLLFFVLTLVIIVTTIFAGISIPYKENKKLKQQIAMVDSEYVFRENFISGLKETQSLLDSVSQGGAKAGLMEGRITQKLQELDANLNKSTVSSKDLYQQVIKALSNAQADKKLLLAAGNKDSVVAAYNVQIQALKANLTQWENSYKQLEMQNLILRQSK